MLEAMRSSWFPVYRLIGSVLAPIAARRLFRAVDDDPSLRVRQPERRGHVPEASGELWVHAASVGELNAAEPLIRRLATASRPIVISTLTHTAARRARERFGEHSSIRHLFAPLDTPGCVRRWLDHTRPDRLLLVETEIWPVMLAACRRRGIPVAMVNARVSARALRRYRRFASLFRSALQVVDPVLCQSRADRDRLAALGVDPTRMTVTGNLKFDVAPADAVSPDVQSWAAGWSGRPVWIAGSTHAGEEEILARAHQRLLQSIPDALMVLVPRHPERSGQALEALEAAGIAAGPVDRMEANPGAQAVVVDRMGKLAELYRCGHAAFVGGSLVTGVGGHNLMEAAVAGQPVLTGPHTVDQQEAADGLASVNGLIRVDSARSLTDSLERLLSDRSLAERTAANAAAFAASQRGALARTEQALAGWLEKQPG